MFQSRVAYLVLEHKDVVMVHEVSVDILERAACCFGIEEINQWYECSIEDGPDDVELPAEGADADWCDFQDDEVA